MTVMLDRLRQLEAARKRGELTQEQFAQMRERLLSVVEDAEVLSESGPSRPPPRRRPAPPPAGQARERQGGRQGAPPKGARPPQRPPQPTAGAQDTAALSPGTGFWPLALMGVCGAILTTVLVGQLIGDFLIAATLAITVLAAVLVKAFQQMEP